ncbi:ABC transporter permease [Aliamphritea spongicola]|uniref:ABC transporter permease n=1 Tax=Aliamphritea spongicola TaxID=707589 RepID=UPI00196B2B6B|nr:iron ABC transporter permease [Aliamphritea spongicola]MBN3563390.1 iron ABC transporter permease [Aliamphritea spongicola]
MTTQTFSSTARSINWLSGSAVLIASILALPVLVICAFLFAGSVDVWSHLFSTVLGDYVGNSLALLVGVSVGVLLLGVPPAWLTSVCEFPGRKIFTWALLLPLAVPAYIIAYTYTGLLDFAGPVQSLIRDITGLGYGEYYFFEIRSLGGATVMLSLVLYPYVYLLSRAAFLEQSSSALEVSRTLGYSRHKAFFKLALPLARPAIIAGLTLALMETLADYGTVQYFGVATFTTGIFRTFYGLGDSAAAAQLAAMLLGFVVLLILLEKYSRRQIKYHANNEQRKQPKLVKLSGMQATAAFFTCLLPVLFGFLLPGGVLLNWAITQAKFNPQDFIELAWNSFTLASAAAVLAVCLALILAYARRMNDHKRVQTSVMVAGMGYALPGTIIAIGILIPMAWLDHQLINLSSEWFGFNPGLIFSGTLFALLFAYMVRFLAVSLGSIQTGLEKIKPSVDSAGRSLGCTPVQVLKRIHVPLMRSSVLTALLIVFVDVLKELPATLILRPFNFNTLAVRAFELASDERLIDAAPASLMIVAVGLLPVILLSRSIARGKE